jgi:hypothetical protein
MKLKLIAICSILILNVLFTTNANAFVYLAMKSGDGCYYDEKGQEREFDWNNSDCRMRYNWFHGPKALAVWVIPGMLISGFVGNLGALLYIALDENNSMASKLSKVIVEKYHANDEDAKNLSAYLADVFAKEKTNPDEKNPLSIDKLQKAAGEFYNTPEFSLLMNDLLNQ